MPAKTDYADQWAEEGLKGWEKLYEFTAKTTYERLIPQIKNRGTAVEVGCGDGVHTVQIAKDFDRTIVIDMSPKFIDEARRRVRSELPSAYVEFICSSIEDCSVTRSLPPQVDAIFLMSILEHLEFPVQVLFGLKKYLDTHGRLLISVPNANSHHRLLGVAMGMLAAPDAMNAQDAILGHQRVYNMNTLRHHLKAAGLERGPFAGNFSKPLSARQMEDWDPLILDGLAKLGKGDPSHAADLCVAAWPVVAEGEYS